ncbi:MAG TPA: SET domain-containing protein [Ignavibacteriales bacterium]|nr:SET domain-containing protein [Ignavibacteriales bacterium]
MMQENTKNPLTEKDNSKFVEVKYSPIHGYGIFSARNFKSGEKILIISGEVISEDECVRREEEENNVYIFWNANNYIDVSGTEKIKYINHSCDPNCEPMERDEESLYLVAYKDIVSGEELTIDYDYPEIYEECRCAECEKLKELSK